MYALTMSNPEGDVPSRSASIACLPNASLLRIFHLLCDSCGPHKPGTCLLVPVCKQWRDLASQVKRLRVLFQGSQQQQVASFRAWCRRHAGQVAALAITSAEALEALSSLAGAAAEAAAQGQPLPLQRLVVPHARLLQPEFCEDTLQPLLGALPSLRHLHASLAAPDDTPGIQALACTLAAAMALEPLQHSTSLTSLVLYGPAGSTFYTVQAYPMLASSLPPTLRSLTWHLEDLRDPYKLSFDHLTGLTHLHISDSIRHNMGQLHADAFTALKQLRRLELVDAPVSEEGLLACKEQLVTLGPFNWTSNLSDLTKLRSLRLSEWDAEYVAQLLGMAPPLQRLKVEPLRGATNGHVPWGTPWALQHHKYATQLKALDLTMTGKVLPVGLLSLTQLQQLHISMDKMDPTVALSWVAALPGLVNLQLLAVPAALTACWHPWLTVLTKLEVLELGQMTDSSGGLFEYDNGAAAAHVSRVLASCAGSSSSGGGRGSRAEGRQVRQLQVLCIAGFTSPFGEMQAAAQQLHAAVVAAVPGVHLFKGSWGELQECGVKLWPAPVAARLQQLVLE
jgi:hypothetical protein